jgi:hypothetical protein
LDPTSLDECDESDELDELEVDDSPEVLEDDSLEFFPSLDVGNFLPPEGDLWSVA